MGSEPLVRYIPVMITAVMLSLKKSHRLARRWMEPRGAKHYEICLSWALVQRVLGCIWKPFRVGMSGLKVGRDGVKDIMVY